MTNESIVNEVTGNLNNEIIKIDELKENLKDNIERSKNFINQVKKDFKKPTIDELIKEMSFEDGLKVWDYTDYTTIATLYQRITRDIKEIVYIMNYQYIFNCGYLEDTYCDIANRLYDTLTDDGEDEEEYKQYEEYDKWVSSLDKLDPSLAEQFAKVKLMKDGWIISQQESWALGLDPDVICHFGLKEEVEFEYPISERLEIIIDYFDEISEIDKFLKIIVNRYDNYSNDFIQIIEYLEYLIENHIVSSIKIS